MDSPGESQTDPSDEMRKADIANGERPEQPMSSEHAEFERERARKGPVGEDPEEFDTGKQTER